jgi:hypothetical protein
MTLDRKKTLQEFDKDRLDLLQAKADAAIADSKVKGLELKVRRHPTYLRIATAQEREEQAAKAQAAGAQAGAQKQQPLSKVLPGEQQLGAKPGATTTATAQLANITAGGPQGPGTQPASAPGLGMMGMGQGVLNAVERMKAERSGVQGPGAGPAVAAGPTYTAPSSITSTTQRETIAPGQIMPNLYGPMRRRTTEQTTRPNVLTAEGAARLNMQQEQMEIEIAGKAFEVAQAYGLNAKEAAGFTKALRDNDVEGQIEALGGKRTGAQRLFDLQRDEARARITKLKEETERTRWQAKREQIDAHKEWREYQQALETKLLGQWAGWRSSWTGAKGFISKADMMTPRERVNTIKDMYDKDGNVKKAGGYAMGEELQNFYIDAQEMFFIPGEGVGINPWGKGTPARLIPYDKVTRPLMKISDAGAKYFPQAEREAAQRALVDTGMFKLDRSGLLVPAYDNPLLKRAVDGAISISQMQMISLEKAMLAGVPIEEAMGPTADMSQVQAEMAAIKTAEEEKAKSATEGKKGRGLLEPPISEATGKPVGRQTIEDILKAIGGPGQYRPKGPGHRGF